MIGSTVVGLALILQLVRADRTYAQSHADGDVFKPTYPTSAERWTTSLVAYGCMLLFVGALLATTGVLPAGLVIIGSGGVLLFLALRRRAQRRRAPPRDGSSGRR